MSQVNTGRRLQICRENALSRRPDLLAELRNAGWRVETEDCLDQCTRCSHNAFALVNGKFQFAASPEAFLAAMTGSPNGRNQTGTRGNNRGRGGS